jgi:hypothetical protein
MDIQKYIAILEEHREELEIATRNINDPDGKMEHLFEALDYAIDSLIAVDESLEKRPRDFISRAELLDYIRSKLEYGSNATREEVLRQIEVAIMQDELVTLIKAEEEEK